MRKIQHIPSVQDLYSSICFFRKPKPNICIVRFLFSQEQSSLLPTDGSRVKEIVSCWYQHIVQGTKTSFTELQKEDKILHSESEGEISLTNS